MTTDLDSLVTSNSKYMKKEDVPEDGVDLTIKHFTKEVVKGDDGEEQKAAVHFVEDGYKPLLLNQSCTLSSLLLPLLHGAAQGFDLLHDLRAKNRQARSHLCDRCCMPEHPVPTLAAWRRSAERNDSSLRKTEAGNFTPGSYDGPKLKLILM